MKSLLNCPAPAKLNLFLHVNGRRADGYHLLQSVFQIIDRSDTLHFSLREDGELHRTNDIEGVPAEEVQDDERQQVAYGNAGHGMRRRQGRHDDAGHRRARRLLKRGTQGPFHAVGCQQVLRREDPRQNR